MQKRAEKAVALSWRQFSALPVIGPGVFLQSGDRCLYLRDLVQDTFPNQGFELSIEIAAHWSPTSRRVIHPLT